MSYYDAAEAADRRYSDEMDKAEASRDRRERDDSPEAPGCPNCNHRMLMVIPWDFGVDPDTGYRDMGQGLRCLGCGAEFYS